MNGPVPIGWVSIVPSSTFSRATIAMPLYPPSRVSRFGVGALTVISTVESSSAVIVSTASRRYDGPAPTSGSRMRSRL